MDPEVPNADQIVAEAARVQALVQSPEMQSLLALLEARLNAIPQVATVEAKLDQIVPGWKTSEFWMTALGHLALILTVCVGALPRQVRGDRGGVEPGRLYPVARRGQKGQLELIAPMPDPLRLPKGRILRTKSARGARLIFERMPEGSARLEGRDVVVMTPVIMHFEVDPASLPKPEPVRKQPFIFDAGPRFIR